MSNRSSHFGAPTPDPALPHGGRVPWVTGPASRAGPSPKPHYAAISGCFSMAE